MRFGVINIDGAYVSAFNVLQEMSRDDIEVYHYNDSATYHVPPHQHDFYELYCLLNGPFTFHVENNRYALKPGSLLLVQPGEVHWPELEQSFHPCPSFCPRRWAPLVTTCRKSS